MIAAKCTNEVSDNELNKKQSAENRCLKYAALQSESKQAMYRNTCTFTKYSKNPYMNCNLGLKIRFSRHESVFLN